MTDGEFNARVAAPFVDVNKNHVSTGQVRVELQRNVLDSV